MTLLALARGPAARTALPRAGASRSDVPTVAAASDLKFALEEIATAFRRRPARRCGWSFGSSGNFARQIRQGAPFEMFLSADEAFVFGLARDGLARNAASSTQSAGSCSSRRRARRLSPILRSQSVRAALPAGASQVRDRQPRARAVRARSQRGARGAGLWTAIERKLVFGENVSQAAQFAATAAPMAASSRYSLALAPRVAGARHTSSCPTRMHQPLRQRMVLLKRAGPTPAAFYDFLQRPGARAILDRYGFSAPGTRWTGRRCASRSSSPSRPARRSCCRWAVWPGARSPGGRVPREGPASRPLVALPLVLPPTVLGFYLLVRDWRRRSPSAAFVRAR